MNKTKIIGTVSLTCAAVLLTGCASVFNSGAKKIAINSTPAGATATVTKLGGAVVEVQRTPCTVSLSAKAGYFRGQQYVVTLELPGYETVRIELHNKVSGWYFGNILIGGAIGMLAVDPATGAMWNIVPNKIEQTLNPVQAAAVQNGDEFLVVLESQLTEGEKQNRTRIN